MEDFFEILAKISKKTSITWLKSHYGNFFCSTKVITLWKITLWKITLAEVWLYDLSEVKKDCVILDKYSCVQCRGVIVQTSYLCSKQSGDSWPKILGPNSLVGGVMQERIACLHSRLYTWSFTKMLSLTFCFFQYWE